MKEFFGQPQGVALGDMAGVMDGAVAGVVDGANLGKEAGFEVVFEGGLVDECAQFVFVGELQVGVVGVEPVDQLL